MIRALPFCLLLLFLCCCEATGNAPIFSNQQQLPNKLDSEYAVAPLQFTHDDPFEVKHEAPAGIVVDGVSNPANLCMYSKIRVHRESDGIEDSDIPHGGYIDPEDALRHLGSFSGLGHISDGGEGWKQGDIIRQTQQPVGVTPVEEEIMHPKDYVRDGNADEQSNGPVLACWDSRATFAVMGSPGGDMGEFLLALTAMEQLKAMSEGFTDEAIFEYFEEYLERRKSFFWHTDSMALNQWQKHSAVANVLQPANATEKERILEASVIPNHIGCFHVRLMLLNPAEYNARPELIEATIRAFYKIYLNPDHPLRSTIRFAVFDGYPGEEDAVINVLAPGYSHYELPKSSADVIKRTLSRPQNVLPPWADKSPLPPGLPPMKPFNTAEIFPGGDRRTPNPQSELPSMRREANTPPRPSNPSSPPEGAVVSDSDFPPENLAGFLELESQVTNGNLNFAHDSNRNRNKIGIRNHQERLHPNHRHNQDFPYAYGGMFQARSTSKNNQISPGRTEAGARAMERLNKQLMRQSSLLQQHTTVDNFMQEMHKARDEARYKIKVSEAMAHTSMAQLNQRQRQHQRQHQRQRQDDDWNYQGKDYLPKHGLSAGKDAEFFNDPIPQGPVENSGMADDWAGPQTLNQMPHQVVGPEQYHHQERIFPDMPSDGTDAPDTAEGILPASPYFSNGDPPPSHSTNTNQWASTDDSTAVESGGMLIVPSMNPAAFHVNPYTAHGQVPPLPEYGVQSPGKMPNYHFGSVDINTETQDMDEVQQDAQLQAEMKKARQDVDPATVEAGHCRKSIPLVVPYLSEAKSALIYHPQAVYHYRQDLVTYFAKRESKGMDYRRKLLGLMNQIGMRQLEQTKQKRAPHVHTFIAEFLQD